MKKIIPISVIVISLLRAANPPANQNPVFCANITCEGSYTIIESSGAQRRATFNPSGSGTSQTSAEDACAKAQLDAGNATPSAPSGGRVSNINIDCSGSSCS